MIEIKAYSSHLEQKHIDFASKYWKKSRRITPEYIYWKFRGKQNEDLPSFILAIKEDKVIGQLGLIPFNVNVEGKVYESQWTCDLMVDNDYRGSGVAKLLYDFAHKQKQITFGSDPSPAASKSMKKAGYKSIKASYKFLFSLNLGGILKLKGLDLKLLNNIPNFYTYFFILYGKIRKQRFDTIGKLEYTKLNNSNDRDGFVSTVHDVDFINWRYEKFKNYYKGINTYSNKKGDSFSGYLADSTYFLTDFKIKNWLAFFDMMAQIIIKYKSQNLKIIRFAANDETRFNALWFFGFIKFRTRGEVIYYTDNNDLSDKIINKKFYYTYSDSDENI
jgi:hypothetical protein